MGTTNFDAVVTSGAITADSVDATYLQVNSTNIVAVTSTGTAASVVFVNSDAPNNSARLNALVSELTNIGLLA